MKNATTGKIIAAIIVCIIGILGSLHIKTLGIIRSDLSFVYLVTLSVFVGFVIYFSDKISGLTLSLKELKITLQQMKDTEVSVKKVAWAILDVIDKNSGFLALPDFDQKGLDEAKEKLKKLIE